MHSAPVSDPENVKRLSVVLPRDIADEICELTPIAKAMLLVEQSDEVLEALDGFPILHLSASTTQWLKALSILESLQLIQALSQSILLDLTQ